MMLNFRINVSRGGLNSILDRFKWIFLWFVLLIHDFSCFMFIRKRFLRIIIQLATE